MRGHGIFKLNDRSLNSVMSDGAGADRYRTSELYGDVTRLETSLRQIEEHFEGNSSIPVRVQRLENQYVDATAKLETTRGSN